MIAEPEIIFLENFFDYFMNMTVMTRIIADRIVNDKIKMWARRPIKCFHVLLLERIMNTATKATITRIKITIPTYIIVLFPSTVV